MEIMEIWLEFREIFSHKQQTSFPVSDILAARISVYTLEYQNQYFNRVILDESNWNWLFYMQCLKKERSILDQKSLL